MIYYMAYPVKVCRECVAKYLVKYVVNIKSLGGEYQVKYVVNIKSLTHQRTSLDIKSLNVSTDVR
jgi:hypothetical protein